MRTIRYIVGMLIVLLLIAADIYIGPNMFSRWFYILAASCVFTLVRLALGPSNPERLLAFKAGSVILVGFCVILSVAYNSDIYMDIAIAWTLQSYLATLVLARYMEGEEK